jgi:hypothetical protein
MAPLNQLHVRFIILFNKTASHNFSKILLDFVLFKYLFENTIFDSTSSFISTHFCDLHFIIRHDETMGRRTVPPNSCLNRDRRSKSPPQSPITISKPTRSPKTPSKSPQGWLLYTTSSSETSTRSSCSSRTFPNHKISQTSWSSVKHGTNRSTSTITKKRNFSSLLLKCIVARRASWK